MIESNAGKLSNSNVLVISTHSPAEIATMQCTIPTQETNRIREYAYALYESHGRKSGEDEENWIRAEQEILKRSR